MHLAQVLPASAGRKADTFPSGMHAGRRRICVCMPPSALSQDAGGLYREARALRSSGLCREAAACRSQSRPVGRPRSAMERLPWMSSEHGQISSKAMEHPRLVDRMAMHVECRGVLIIGFGMSLLRIIDAYHAAIFSPSLSSHESWARARMSSYTDDAMRHSCLEAQMPNAV